MKIMHSNHGESQPSQKEPVSPMKVLRFLAASLTSISLIVVGGGIAAAAPPASDKITSIEVVEALAGVDGVLDSADGVTVAADADSVAKAEVAGSSIDIPLDASDGVSLNHEESGEITIDLPGVDNSASGTVVADGTVAYPSTDGGFANAVQANSDGSVRMLTVIDNSAAPTSFDYGVNLSQGGVIELAEGGGAVVYDSHGNPVTAVGAPWAKDADGQSVETWFTTDGLVLTQHVAHDVPGVAYPVVADPVWIPAALVASGVAIVKSALVWCGLGYLSGSAWHIFWDGWVWREITKSGKRGCFEGAVGRFGGKWVLNFIRR